MNPRQRRGVLLIALAVIGAAAVFFAVSNYLRDVRSQLGPMVTVVAARNDLPPFAAPGEDDLVFAEVPERWLPTHAFRDATQIGDRVTAAAIPAGTLLSEGMFLDRPAISPGEREIAILVDAETGVGGKLTSGSVVDIFATFGGTDDGIAPSSRIVVQRAEIIEVGSPVDVPDDGVGAGSVGFGSEQQLPVTFRLSVEDARTLTYVESFATSIRLALRSPLDDDILPGDVTVYQPAPSEIGRFVRPVPRPGESPDDVVVEEEPDTGGQPDEGATPAPDEGAEAGADTGQDAATDGDAGAGDGDGAEGDDQ